jgi:hypothetical protein
LVKIIFGCWNDNEISITGLNSEWPDAVRMLCGLGCSKYLS